MFGSEGELAGTRALVVDDETDNRALLATFLSMCGMEVSEAGSGDEAFDVFRRDRPDIISSDIWMANGDGCSLIRRVRSLSAEDGGLTPGIAISGGASEGEAIEAGFHFYLRKPVEPVRLLDVVRDFVKEGGMGRATWSVGSHGCDVLMKFDGHVTATDMRAAVSMLSKRLEGAGPGCRIIVDLRHLEGFDPSVASAGQTAIWPLRHKILRVVIVGGSTFARLVARSACLLVGAPCEFADAIPGLAIS